MHSALKSVTWSLCWSLGALSVPLVFSACEPEPEYEGVKTENTELKVDSFTVSCVVVDNDNCGGGEYWTYEAVFKNSSGPESTTYAYFEVRDAYTYADLASNELSLTATGSELWSTEQCLYGGSQSCTNCVDLIFEVFANDRDGFYTADRTFAGKDICNK